jgi:hypothetical protein
VRVGFVVKFGYMLGASEILCLWMMIGLIVVLLWEKLEVALSIFTGGSNIKGLGPRELHLLDVMARGEKEDKECVPSGSLSSAATEN